MWSPCGGRLGDALASCSPPVESGNYENAERGDRVEQCMQGGGIVLAEVLEAVGIAVAKGVLPQCPSPSAGMGGSTPAASRQAGPRSSNRSSPPNRLTLDHPKRPKHATTQHFRAFSGVSGRSESGADPWPLRVSGTCYVKFWLPPDCLGRRPARARFGDYQVPRRNLLALLRRVEARPQRNPGRQRGRQRRLRGWVEQYSGTEPCGHLLRAARWPW